MLIFETWSLWFLAGIAATDDQDVLASFSNYGSSVSYTALSVNLVTIFPGGHYVMVSGTVALGRSVAHVPLGLVFFSMDHAAVSIDSQNPDLKRKLGKGQINTDHTVVNLMFPYFPGNGHHRQYDGTELEASPPWLNHWNL